MSEPTSQEDVPSNVTAGHGDGPHPASTESSHAKATITAHEAGLPTEVGDDSEDRHADPAIPNLRILQEIKTLQQRLLEVEKEARPKLDRNALETEWNIAREKLGPEEEKKAWREERRHRKAALVALEGSDLQSRRGHGYHDLSRQELDDEWAYNLRLFKIRKTWERKIAGLVGSRDTDSDGDETDSELDLLDDVEVRAADLKLHSELLARRDVLRRVYELERENLEKEHEWKMDHWTDKGWIRRKRRQRNAEVLQEPADDAPIDLVKRTDESVVEPHARSELLRVPWDQFKVLRGLIKEEDSAAIDVLIGEPVIEFEYGRRPPVKGRKPETTRTLEMKTVTKENLVPSEAPMPERIRIHSGELRRILNCIHPGDTLFKEASSVLLRPFRHLDYYNEAIRERYKELKDRFGKELSPRRAPGSHSEASARLAGANKENDDAVEEKPVRSEPLAETKSGEDKGREEKEGKLQAEGEDKEENEDNADSPVTFEHLKLLVEFMDNDIQSRVSLLESGKCRKVFFSDLWYLFQPGVLVIRNDGKQAYRILSMRSVGHRVIDPFCKWYERRVRKLNDEEEEQEEEASMEINCVYLDFDGKQLGPVLEAFRIPRFEREKAVTSLDIYPLQFHPSKNDSAGNTADAGAEFKRYLADRGRKFLKAAAVRLAAIQPMYYAGPALKTHDDIESQVVVDFEAALGIEEHIKMHWKPELKTLVGSVASEKGRKGCDADCCAKEQQVIDDSYVEERRNEEFMRHLLPQTRDEMPSVIVVPRPLDTKAPEAGLAEDDFVIMSYRVFGFVLRTRKWAQLDLTHLNETRPSQAEDGSGEPETAFDELVLPPKHKDMILSLITQHFRDKETSHNDEADIVRGKGKGLILLLHGAPGVGKTTTAEGVAQKFNKPLFQLTCGDLGTTAKDVESALETNFALASRWGCILLLDEADVFLAQRTKEDFKRNGLVAVFLRVLEYYAGILFLTTNRVGDFDEAFASRIHISLYYPELGEKETRDVFRLNLKRIRDRFKRKGREFAPDEMEIGSFASNYWRKNPFDRWNGRQIRNACQTAVALAEFEAQGNSHTVTLKPDAKVQLKASHFETVAEAYLAFSKHLRDIYGTHAARRAKEAGLRAMWVNENGEVMGSVGPKEAGIVKADRKSRFKQRAQGRYANTSYEQTQQVVVSRDQGPPYRGSQGGVQGDGGRGYADPSTRPTRPAEYYDDTFTAQQYSNPGPQVPRGMAASGPPPPLQQNWDSYGPSSAYDQQQFETGGRGAYPQQRNYRGGAHHLKPSREPFAQHPGFHRVAPGGHAAEFNEPVPRDDMEGTP